MGLVVQCVGVVYLVVDEFLPFVEEEAGVPHVDGLRLLAYKG